MSCHTLSVCTVREIQSKDQFRSDCFLFQGILQNLWVGRDLLRSPDHPRVIQVMLSTTVSSLVLILSTTSLGSLLWVLTTFARTKFFFLCLDGFFFVLLACHWALPRISTLPRAWLPHLHLLNKDLWYFYTLLRPEPPEFQTFPRLKSPNS